MSSILYLTLKKGNDESKFKVTGDFLLWGKVHIGIINKDTFHSLNLFYF